MDRRTFLKLSAAGVGAAVAGGIGCRRPSARPNVVFVAIDDLNDWVGCLGGHPDTLTPHIDRLAGRGVLFANAHSQATNCGGSRTGVLTGRAPTSTGVYDNYQDFRPAYPELLTLPQRFAAGGYEVLGGGKVFHVQDDASWHEFHEPVITPDEELGPIPERWRRGPAGLDWAPLAGDEERMYDAGLARWAVERIERGFERPFFLALGFFRPHLPWMVPSRYFEPFAADRVTLPEVPPNDLADVPRRGRLRARGRDHRWILDSGLWGEAVAAYLASIHFADAMIGRVLDAVEHHLPPEDTVVVLWSDHGFHLGEKSHWRKFDLWEEATRVPLVVTAPGRVPAGGRSARAVSLGDLPPTLLDLCGLPGGEELDGESLAALLADPAAPRERPALTSVHPSTHAVRSDRWRYIRYGDGEGGEELYDHDADPEEWTNLASDPALAEVKRALAAAIPSAPAEPIAHQTGAGTGTAAAGRESTAPRPGVES